MLCTNIPQDDHLLLLGPRSRSKSKGITRRREKEKTQASHAPHRAGTGSTSLCRRSALLRHVASCVGWSRWQNQNAHSPNFYPCGLRCLVHVLPHKVLTFYFCVQGACLRKMIGRELRKWAIQIAPYQEFCKDMGMRNGMSARNPLLLRELPGSCLHSRSQQHDE